MSRRPLFLAGLCCLAAAAGAFFFSLMGTAAVLLLFCLLAVCRFPKDKRNILLVGGCGLLTCLSVLLWQTQAQELRAYGGETVELKGMITAVKYGSGWIQTEVWADLLGQEEQLELVSYATDVPDPGHDFRAVVKLEEADPRYSGKGDILQGTILEMEDLGLSGDLYGRALQLRSRLISRAEHLFHGVGEEIILGLLLGERAALSNEVEEVFEKSGAAHLLTVSGFHISMMAGGIYWLLQKLGQKPKITAIVTIPLIFFLAMVEGWTVSVVRAAIMSALFYFAAVSERDYDGLSAWGLAVLVILLPQPENLFSMSFLLSFSAVLGILLFRKQVYGFFLSIFPAPKPGSRVLRLYCRVLELLSLALAANSLILPFLWYFFGYIPLISLLSSLTVVPLMPFIIGSAAAVILCPLKPLAELLAGIPQLLAEGLYRILSLFAAWDWNLYGQDDLLLFLLIGFCGFILVLRFWNVDRKTAGRGMGAYLAVSCVLFIFSHVPGLEQAELISCRSAVVLTYQNHGIIVGSPEKPGDLAEIEKVLDCAHVETVDLLLLTKMPKDSGITALELHKRRQPAVTAAVEELDAFDLTGVSYQLGQQQIAFWGSWTLETTEQGALLSNGRKTMAKLHSDKAFYEADALLFDNYQFLLMEGMEGEQTWDKQLKISVSVD